VPGGYPPPYDGFPPPFSTLSVGKPFPSGPFPLPYVDFAPAERPRSGTPLAIC
jgi:hypothetical protein